MRGLVCATCGCLKVKIEHPDVLTVAHRGRGPWLVALVMKLVRVLVVGNSFNLDCCNVEQQERFDSRETAYVQFEIFRHWTMDVSDEIHVRR